MSGATRRTRTARFWWIVGLVVLTDVVTKALAHTLLVRHRPYPILGSVVQLVLVHNPGAAFGLYLGLYSRWIFAAGAVLALVVLWRMAHTGPAGDRIRTLALGLIAGGAMGNLVNRVWSVPGVVDFLDVGVGSARWPTFNLADVAISIGAGLLVFVLWREDARGPMSATT